MNIASAFHASLFLLPFVGALALLALAARYTVYRRPPSTLDDVALFVRQVDVLELAALLDPLVPLTLRESLSDEAYRRELDTHIRLVREYLDRVNYNVRVIQNWVAGEHTQMAGKNPKDYNLHERLVVEALQSATRATHVCRRGPGKALALGGAADRPLAGEALAPDSKFEGPAWD
jgi:hypothetical protein